jgi:hypothetical protein
MASAGCETGILESGLLDPPLPAQRKERLQVTDHFPNSFSGHLFNLVGHASG